MHAARLDRSPRLQRAYALLADGEPRSTRDISLGAGVYAVSAVISELRANGCDIDCWQEFVWDEQQQKDVRVWFYRMGTEGEQAA